MEENASGSSSAVLGAQASEPLQETANAAEVLALSEEVKRLRALAQAPKRRPGRPRGYN